MKNIKALLTVVMAIALLALLSATFVQKSFAADRELTVKTLRVTPTAGSSGAFALEVLDKTGTNAFRVSPTNGAPVIVQGSTNFTGISTNLAVTNLPSKTLIFKRGILIDVTN